MRLSSRGGRNELNLREGDCRSLGKVTLGGKLSKVGKLGSMREFAEVHLIRSGSGAGLKTCNNTLL
jgi:hypothetical protein